MLAALALLAAIPLFAQTESDAQALTHSGKIDEAIGIYSALARKSPGTPRYEDQIGFLLAATKRVSEALPHFRRATEIDPRYAPAFYHEGVALWLNHQPEPAISALRKAVELAPDSAEYLAAGLRAPRIG